MVKHLFFVMFGACLVLGIGSCSSSRTTTPAAAAVSALPFMIGKIEVIGNEPFTKLALRTDATHLFLLRASKDLEKELSANQQRVLKVFYSGRQESGADHYLDADHIEIPEK